MEAIITTLRIGAALLCVMFSARCLADVVVVVHPKNSATINKETVQRLFLGKLNEFPNGERALLVNQSPGTDARAEFDQRMLNLSTAQVSERMAKLIFTGRISTPMAFDTDADVINFIQQHSNAIGYIDSSSINDDIKIINID